MSRKKMAVIAFSMKLDKQSDQAAKWLVEAHNVNRAQIIREALIKMALTEGWKFDPTKQETTE